MVTGLRSVPSRLADANCSSSAPSILPSSSLVHPVIGASPLSELDQNLGGFAVVHSAVPIGHVPQTHDTIKDPARLDAAFEDARRSASPVPFGSSSLMYAMPALKTFAQINDGRAASGKAPNRSDSRVREARRILPAQSLSQKHSSNRVGSRGHWEQLGCSLGDGPPIWRLVTQRRAGDWLFGDLPAGSLAGAEQLHEVMAGVLERPLGVTG